MLIGVLRVCKGCYIIGGANGFNKAILALSNFLINLLYLLIQALHILFNGLYIIFLLLP